MSTLFVESGQGDFTYTPRNHRDIPLRLSIIDTCAEAYKARSMWWKSSGVDYSAGRVAPSIHAPAPRSSVRSGGATPSATSQFNPALAEVLFDWYTSPGDLVVDPFAGGPTRGHVAGVMGRRYLGVDIRDEQVAANAREVTLPGVTFTVGDGTTHQYPACDAVLTCPPYHNLERYSDHDGDLSNMTWGDFIAALRRAVAQTATHLKAGGFSVWVVGDIKGRSLLAPMVEAFDTCPDLTYWETLVIRHRYGTAPMRAAVARERSVRVHSYVVVARRED